MAYRTFGQGTKVACEIAAMAADARPAAEARYESSSGRFTIPARSALVFVVN